jgi:hypothetical protein
MKILVVAAVAAMALGAVSVSSASATIVSAKFSSFGLRVSASGVSIQKGSGTAKSCSVSSAEGWTEPNGSFVASSEGVGGAMRFTCTDATYLRLRFNGFARYDTVTGRYYLQVADYSSLLASPWGTYYQTTGGTNQWTWVNGSGATPSTMTLKEQYVGNQNLTGEKITITGTVTAKGEGGGLITLSH